MDTNSLHLRPATPDDASAIHALTRVAYQEYQSTDAPSSVFQETEEALRDALQAGTLHGFVIEKDGVVVGSVRYQWKDGLYFFRLGVAPELRGYGIATLLLDRLEEEAELAKASRLWCRARLTVPRNIAIYLKRGFTQYDLEYVRRGNTDVPTAFLEKRLPC